MEARAQQGEYQHIIKNFKLHNYSYRNIERIGKLLGLASFTGTENYMSLYKKYESVKFGEICKMSKQIRVNGLSLNLNDKPQIVCQIAVTCFPNLVFLDLSGNRIQTIEVLCCIEMRKIKYLNLQANHITNLIPLSKLFFIGNPVVLLTQNHYREIPSIIPSHNVELDNTIIDFPRITKFIFTLKMLP